MAWYHLLTKYSQIWRTAVNYEKSFKKRRSLPISQSTKKSLRRNIEKCFRGELKFVIVRGTLFLHPSVMSVVQVIMLFCEPEKNDNVAKQQRQLEKKLSVSKTKCLGFLDQVILNQKNLRSWVFNMLAHSSRKKRNQQTKCWTPTFSRSRYSLHRH